MPERLPCPYCKTLMNYAFPAPIENSFAESHAHEFMRCPSCGCPNNKVIIDVIAGKGYSWERRGDILTIEDDNSRVSGNKAQIIAHMVSNRPHS